MILQPSCSRCRLRHLTASLMLASIVAASPSLGAGQEQRLVAPAQQFLNSLGACSAVSEREEQLPGTARAVEYLGLRWLRVVHDECEIDELLELHRRTGVKFSLGMGSGNADIDALLSNATRLAKAGALLAVEGNNEPNNWPIDYQGTSGGGRRSWRAVAALQRDLYQAVKSNPALQDYPVWHVSEVGAQNDNVGLQFLRIPTGANTLMPDGTQYSDAANCHNYLFHPNRPRLSDNQAWNAADPSSSEIDNGLYDNYGLTWRRQFRGYSKADLERLPRVTTETGCLVGENGVTEHMQGVLYLSVYLSQFKRQWSHTAIYLLRDRTDEEGNQAYGFYNGYYSPRLAAKYLHHLTTILADTDESAADRDPPTYSFDKQPATVHDLLLKKSDGSYWLVVWSERFRGGTDAVTVKFAAPLAEARIYDPTKSADPQQTFMQTDSVVLTLTDHPLVIELR